MYSCIVRATPPSFCLRRRSSRLLVNSRILSSRLDAIHEVVLAPLSLHHESSRSTFPLPSRRRFATQHHATAAQVFSWGTGDNGQLGHSDVKKDNLGNVIETLPRAVKGLDNLGVKSLAAGSTFSGVVTKDGRVLTWGSDGGSGALGNGTEPGEQCYSPLAVQGRTSFGKAVQVSCGEKHTAVLNEEGRVYTWGFEGVSSHKGGFLSKLGFGIQDSHCLGRKIERSEKTSHPKRVVVGGEDDVKLQAISSGKCHMMGLGKEGEVWIWGRGDYGLMGDASNRDAEEPIPVSLLLEMDINVIQVACGQSFNLVLSDKGEVYSWGKNDQGQLGLGGGISMDVYAMENIPRLVESLVGQNIVKVSAGVGHALAVNDKGQVWMWGYRTWMEPHQMTALEGHHVKDVAAGNNYSVIVNAAGQVYAWGKNVFVARAGILAQGDKKRYSQPERIKSLDSTPIQRVACGHKHALALSGKP